MLWMMNYKYLFLSLLASPIFLINNQSQAIQPIQGESAGCHKQVDISKRQITQIKDLELIEASTDRYSYAESGRPENFTHSINFVVEGKGGSNLMTSPALQKSIASDIMAQCSKVGSVVFTANNSDWVEIVGKMADGSIRAFECGTGLSDEPWGTQVCL